VTSPTAGTVSIAEYEFPALGDLSVEIEAPQGASPVDPLRILFILDSSLFGVLDVVRMELVEIFREGVKVPDCLAIGIANPDPCISQRSLVDGDVHITVLATAASTWTFDQLPFGPVGPEFQVNTYTTGYQSYFSKAAAAAFDGSGNFVVVWQSDGQDGDDFGIFGQRYDFLGTPQGPEFPVNTYTTGAQRRPAVAAASSGDFVVVWQSYDQDGDAEGIFGQRYDSAGATQGLEFQVNTYTTGDQGAYLFGQGVAVDADAAGNFIVVWKSTDQDGSGDGVFAQRYDSTGATQGPEFQVNTYTTGNQGGYLGTGGVDVAADPAGSFVVVWNSEGQDGDYTGVFGQRYDGAGMALGLEFQVNTYTTGSQGGYSGGDLAVDTDAAGNFVVVWSSYDGQDGDGHGIFGQRYDSAGVAQGAEFQVNTYTTDDQGYLYGGGVSVAADPTGNFVVVWQSYADQDGNDWGIFGQRYDNAGVAQGPEFQVNTYTTSSQDAPTVTADGNARFVVVWSSYAQDGDAEGVFAQRFATK
jgi:hypothetical protein